MKNINKLDENFILESGLLNPAIHSLKGWVNGYIYIYIYLHNRHIVDIR